MYFDTVSSRGDEVQPFGFESFVSQFCPVNADDGGDPCAYLILANSSAMILLQFRQVRAFDIRFDQTIFVTLGADTLGSKAANSLLTFQAFFTITASHISPQLGSYAIGVPLLCTTLLSQFFVSSQFDMVPFLLSTQGTCSTSSQRSLSLFSLYGPFWAGGDTMLDRSVRMVGIVVLMHVIVVLALVLIRQGGCCVFIASNRSEEQLSPLGHASALVSVQVTLLFAGAAAFSSGALLSSPDREAQGVGMLDSAVFVLALVVAAKRLWLDSEWSYLYILSSDEAKSTKGLTSLFGPLARVSGYWFSERYIMSSTVPDSNSAVALDKWIVCKEFEGFHSLQAVVGGATTVSVTKKAVAVHYLVSLLPLVIAGLSPRYPLACFWQGVAVAALHGLAIAFLVKFAQPRSRAVFVLSVLIRALNVAVFTLLALFSGDSAVSSGFTALEIGMLVFGVMRLVISIAIWRGDLVRPLVEPKGRTKASVAQDPSIQETSGGNIGDGDAHLEKPLLQFPSADTIVVNQQPQQHSSDPATSSDPAATGEDAPSGALDERGNPLPSLLEESVSVAGTTGFDPVVEPEQPEPRFIRDAWPTRPKPKQSDYIEMRRPLWFPEQRPHVRTDNVPQLTIEFSSYSVRTDRRQSASQ